MVCASGQRRSRRCAKILPVGGFGTPGLHHAPSGSRVNWRSVLACSHRYIFHREKGNSGRLSVKVPLEGSTTIIRVTHSITICAEKLGKRDVSRPTCSCGWTATWAYVTEKCARDAGQQHIMQILAQMQTVDG
jgi:hypothetical protein